jgi:hypothetical protein
MVICFLNVVECVSCSVLSVLCYHIKSYIFAFLIPYALSRVVIVAFSDCDKVVYAVLCSQPLS